MKKIIILCIALALNIAAFAQRVTNIHAQSIHSYNPYNLLFSNDGPGARTSAAGDTFTLSHITATDTTTLYTVGADSGYVTGTDYWDDKAFAEQYTFNGADSSMQVIGVFALFGGKVNPASALTVTFNIWDRSNPVPITGDLYYNGFPNTLFDTLTVPVTQLGIGATVDTLKEFLFATPTVRSGPFYAGYSIAYSFDTLNGDTIGMACSKDGERLASSFTTLSYNVIDSVDTTLDTIINVQNATLGTDNTWYDNYTQNDSLKDNLAIYPIVVIGGITKVAGITRNSLTFFGNYPNPANDNTNIKFTLSKGADVTIQVTDMAGRLLHTIHQAGLSAGMHLVPFNTAALPAGDYLYLIRTSAGDGIAGKMSVVH